MGWVRLGWAFARKQLIEQIEPFPLSSFNLDGLYQRRAFFNTSAYRVIRHHRPCRLKGGYFLAPARIRI